MSSTDSDADRAELEAARQVLAQAGVTTPFGYDELREIVSSSSSTPSVNSSENLHEHTDARGTGESYGVSKRARRALQRDEEEDLSSSQASSSLPSALRRELRTPDAHGIGGVPTPATAALATPALDGLGFNDVEDRRGLWRRVRELEEALDEEKAAHARDRRAAERKEAELMETIESSKDLREKALSEQKGRLLELEGLCRRLEGNLSSAKERFDASVGVSDASGVRRISGGGGGSGGWSGFWLSSDRVSELRGMDAREVSLADHVRLRVSDVLGPLLESKDRAEAAAAEAVAELEAERAKLGGRVRAAEAREESCRAEMEAAVGEMEGLRRAVETNRARAERAEAELASYASSAARSGSLEREAVTLREQVERLRSSKAVLEGKTESLERKLQRLEEERAKVLEREREASAAAASAERRGQESRHALDSALARLRSVQAERDEIEEKRSALASTIERMQLEHRRSLDERLDQELERVRAQTDDRIRQLKDEEQAVREREKHVLQEQLLSTQSQLERAKSDLDAALQESKNVQKSLESRILETEQLAADDRQRARDLQAQLDRWTLTAEETAKELASEKRRADKLREERDALRSESVQSIAAAKAEAEAATQRAKNAEEIVRAYEQLENELDDSIRHAAELPTQKAKDNTQDNEYDDDTFEDDEESRTSRSLAVALAGLPTRARRRARQAVVLAREVVEARREASQWEQRFRAAEAEVVKERESAERLHKAVTESRRPEAVVVSTLQRRDRELEAARRNERVLRTRVDQLLKDLAEGKRQRDALAQDLERALQRRAEMDALRDLVHAALSAQHSKSQSLVRRAADTVAKQTATFAQTTDAASPAPHTYTPDSTPSPPRAKTAHVTLVQDPHRLDNTLPAWYLSHQST